MNKARYALTFACHNAVAYTRMCIESMVRHGTPLDRLVVVDNGSSDETRAYLETLPLGGRLYNAHNLGCGVAWNQGALAMQAEWSIIMNNDVLVSPHWIERLIGHAERIGVKVVSPALIEGPLDYDFEAFAAQMPEAVRDVARMGARHAVCLAVHESVWLEVGYFQPVPKLLGYEDSLFFNELSKSGIQTAMSGASWLHHYGSITQTAMKLERGLRQNEGLQYRYNYRMLKQSWMERKLKKVLRKRQERAWREQEVRQHGISIHGLREGGHFRWT